MKKEFEKELEIVKTSEMNISECAQESEILDMFGDELPVNGMIQPIRDSIKEDFSDFADDEFYDLCKVSKQKFDNEHPALKDLDKFESKVLMKVIDFKKEITITNDEIFTDFDYNELYDNHKQQIDDLIVIPVYSGRIRYRIFADEKKQKFVSPKFFDPDFEESAFNSLDYSRNEKGFDKFGYKVAKTKEALKPLIITYSTLVENGSTVEKIEAFKQKLLAKYDEYVTLKNAYMRKHYS